MDPTELLLANLVVVLGAIIQASTGVGGGFVVVPALAAIDVFMIPGPVILGSLPLSIAMALRGRRDLDTASFPAITWGLIPGSIAGAWLLTRIPLENAGVLYGLVVLIAVGLSVAGLVVPLGRVSCAATGAVAGVMGTSGGNGGVILALLYQHAEGPALRATLGLLYGLASTIMLAILAAFGRFGPHEIGLGLLLIPGFLLGFALSGRIAAALDGGHARTAVLTLAVLSALALIFSSL